MGAMWTFVRVQGEVFARKQGKKLQSCQRQILRSGDRKGVLKGVEDVKKVLEKDLEWERDVQRCFQSQNRSRREARSPNSGTHRALTS